MQQLQHNTSSALRIDYFDIIGIELHQHVEEFRVGTVPKNKILETFKRIDKLPFSNLNLKFSDNTWDFSAATTLPISPNLLVFNFNVNSDYSEILKMFVLNEIVKKNAKIRTLKTKFSLAQKALEAFEQEGYSDFARVPKTVIKRFFEHYTNNVSYNTYCSYKGLLLMFVDFYERTFEEMNDKSIRKYLNERNTAKINNNKEAGKTPEIPIDYFPVFIDGLKGIMRDENKDTEDRITAAVIILYSQIGFRTSEMFTVKTNSLQQVWSPDKCKPLYYLEYKSFKHGASENDWTIGKTYINELSLEAYNLLLILCEPARSKLGIDNLYVSRFQKKSSLSAQAFSERYRKFALRHWYELQCLNIGDEYDDLSYLEVGKYFKPAKDGTYTYDKESSWAKPLKLDDRIYYPTITQFRVSVCTSLYRQQIPLHYIKKHMNHLSEDMAAYYIRPKKNLEKEYSETVYKAVFKDGSKMLGINGDAFINKINEFISQNQLNIKDDTDEVIKTVAKNFPLRSKLGGICIRCGDVIPCASNDSTDVIYCAFGMCTNHCHMFFMADISYEDYLKHKDIVEYNQQQGFIKAYQKEINKMRYIIENSLIPELESLKEEMLKQGEESLSEKYPQLTYIINNFDEIKQEVESWI